MTKALLIGINKYLNSQFNLQGCVNDMTNVYSFLKKNNDTIHITTLQDHQATKIGIEKELYKLRESKNETIIVYYSGHGTYCIDRSGDENDRKDEALCPTDVSRGNLILDDYIGSCLEMIDESCHVITIFDCCHSGTNTRMVKPDTTVRSIDYHRLEKDLSKYNYVLSIPVGIQKSERKNQVYFSGCRSDEVSLETRTGNGQITGVFTYYFLKTLQEGEITYNALYSKVKKEIQRHGFTQTPQLECPKELLNTKVLL